jgi:hypothetical protein
VTIYTESLNYKFVVLLNKKIDPGIALNATAHMVASLMAKANESEKMNMKFLDYADADGQVHPVSGLSLIVLRADNSNKIRTARQRALESNILHVDFTESMTGDTYVEQMERTRSLPESELNYYGICLFGIKDHIDSITSKFSLWR